MSETDGVTFVQGRAESQQTEGEGSGMPTDEREAAVAAVKAALKGEAKKAGEDAAKEASRADEQEPLRPRTSTERDENGKFIKSGKEEAQAKPKSEEDADDGESLKRVLKERKQMAAQKQAIQQENQKVQNQLLAFQRQLQQQQQELERDRERLALLRKDPARAIRENGWDPENFILDLAQEGTPEGKAARERREWAEQMKEMRDWKAEQERKRQEYAENQKIQARQQHRSSVENKFVSLAMDAEKHPNLASFYDGHTAGIVGLIAEGDAVADQYRELTGKEATVDEIVEYLEERKANWYKSRSGAGSTGSQQAQATVTKGRPTPGSATGRTLSSEDSSERRSLGKSFSDLDGDERLAAAREAVGAALRSSGEHR